MREPWRLLALFFFTPPYGRPALEWGLYNGPILDTAV